MSQITKISKIKTIINGEEKIFQLESSFPYIAGNGIKIDETTKAISITLPWAEEAGDF